MFFSSTLQISSLCLFEFCVEIESLNWKYLNLQQAEGYISSVLVFTCFEAESSSSDASFCWGPGTGVRSFHMVSLYNLISVFSFLLLDSIAFNISEKFKNLILLFLRLLTWRLSDLMNLKKLSDCLRMAQSILNRHWRSSWRKFFSSR